MFLSFSTDFDLAQHFSCSVKTGMWSNISFKACRQLRKKDQHNFIGQLKHVCDVPTLVLSLGLH